MTQPLPPITIDVAGLGLIFYSPFAGGSRIDRR